MTFELRQPRNYLMTYEIQGETTWYNFRSISLSEVGGSTVFEEIPGDRGTRAGSLIPGRYRFVLQHKRASDVGTQGPYSAELVLGA